MHEQIRFISMAIQTMTGKFGMFLILVYPLMEDRTGGGVVAEISGVCSSWLRLRVRREVLWYFDDKESSIMEKVVFGKRDQYFWEIMLSSSISSDYFTTIG